MPKEERGRRACREKDGASLETEAERKAGGAGQRELCKKRETVIVWGKRELLWWVNLGWPPGVHQATL